MFGDPQMAFINQAHIDALEAGIDGALTRIEQALKLEVFAEKIPLIGDKLKDAFDQGEVALQKISVLKAEILDKLTVLNNAPEYAEAYVEEVINEALEAVGFIGGTVDAIVNGAEVSFAFLADSTFDYNQTLATDLGLPGMTLTTSGQAAATIGYHLDFTIGVDGLSADGFYVRTNGGAPELSIDLNVSTPNFGAETSLGFLSFSAVDAGSSLSGSFAIDLKDNDGKLRISELGGDILDARLTGNANVDVHLDANMGAAALPKFSADLAIDWVFSNDLVNPGDNNANFGAAPTVVFNNVRYDFGTFVEDFVRPILNQLDPILEPINQALAVFRTDLTFLKAFPGWEGIFDKAGSNNGGTDAADGKITLLDFIKMAQPGVNLVPATEFIDIVDDVVDWAAFFQGKDFGPDAYDLGSFQIVQDIRDAAFSLADAVPHIITTAADLGSFLGGLSGSGYNAVNEAGQTGKDILSDMFSGGAFGFPILSNPLEAFKLLLGGDANLFSLDLPEMALGFGGGFDDNGAPVGNLVDLANFPVFPGINIVLSGALEVAMDLAFGYDTRGLKQFAETGFTDYAAVFNGFFVSDQVSGDGSDRPEVTISTALELAVEASIMLASVGGAGNIAGQILLNLNDVVNGSTRDGKVYLDEMGAALTTNPFSLFDTSGLITAGFGAYVNVGGYDVWRYNTPRITLAGFSFSDNPVTGDNAPPPPPPGLGDIVGGTLLLNIGSRSGERDISNKLDGAEAFEIGGSGDLVGVLALGRSQSFDNVDEIVGDGGAQDDAIVFDPQLTIRAVLSGGAGQDILYSGAGADELRGGSGRDYLDGRAGDDELYGEDGDDVLIGGAGADRLNGGAGLDIASYEASDAAVLIDLGLGIARGGHAAGDSFVGIEVFEGSNRFGDELRGGVGDDIFLGLGGDDILAGAAGSDFLVGGDGNDRLDGGTGHDVMFGGLGDDLYIVDSALDMVNDEGHGIGGGRDRVVAGVDYSLSDAPEKGGIEELELSGGARRGTGNALANLIIGTSGNDQLDGAGGADDLRGGAGNDVYLFDSQGDRVVENAGGGTDEIRLATGAFLAGSFSLSDAWALNVENATLLDHARSIDLTGNGLNNRLVGNNQMNKLYGLGGDDVLAPGLGYGDQVEGGDGTDTLVIDYSSLDAGYVEQLADRFYYSANGYYLSYVNIERFDITGSATHHNTLFGGDLDDRLIGGAGNDVLNSGKSAATSSTEVVDGGAGANDRWIADLGATAADIHFDVAANQAGWLVLGNGLKVRGIELLELTTGSGNDVISTRPATGLFPDYGRDTINTGAGDDHVKLGAGYHNVEADSVDGGTGLDTLEIDFSALVGGYIQQSATQFYYSASGYYTRYANFERFILTGSATRDNVLFGGNYADELTGGAGHDQLTSGAGSDKLISDGGDDFLDSGTGRNETVDGGAGKDVWQADLATMTAAVTVVAANTQAAFVTLANGTKVRGIEGLRLNTGSGNDVLSSAGYEVTDDIAAGAGDDYVNIGWGAGDAADGGDGTDTLVVDFSRLNSGYFSQSADRFYYSAYGYYTTYSNFERFDITGSSKYDNTLHGGSLDDRLIGGDAGDVLDSKKSAAAGSTEVIDGGHGTDWWKADLGATAADIHFDAGMSQMGELVLGSGLRVQRIERIDLSTGAGNDDISTAGFAFGDAIVTGAGNDRVAPGLSSSGDADQVDGGAGLDTLVLDYSSLNAGYITQLATQFYYSAYGYYLYYENFERFIIAGSATHQNELFGGQHDDQLYGGVADDRLIGGAGSDMLFGGGGNDFLASDLGAGETIHGGAGNDTWRADLSGTKAAVKVNAAATQAAEITLANGTTVRAIEALHLKTGAGNDVLSTAGYGLVDAIESGAGDDYVNIGCGAGDAADGGAGTDTLVLDLSRLTNGYVNQSATWFYYSAFGNYTTYKNFERFDLTGSATHSNDLFGGDLDDCLVGGALDDVLDSKKGAAANSTEEIIGGGGTDWWKADLGATATDIVFDARANQTATLTLGNGARVRGIERIELTTGSGDDQISTAGFAFADNVKTGDGNDWVALGLGGGDSADGGAGTDTLVLDFSTLTAGYISQNDGYFYYSAWGTYTTYANFERFDLTGSATHVNWLVGGGLDDRLTGGAADDVLTGNGGNDTLSSGAGGLDELRGGGGNDAYYIDSAAAVAFEAASSGTDTVYASISYTLAAGQEIEALRASSGTATSALNLSGNEFAQTITGNAGANVLDGKGGADTLKGLGGNDTYYVDNAADKVIEAKGGGTDKLLSSVSYILAAGQEVESLSTTSTVGTTAIKLTGNEFAQTITGNAGANVLDGKGGADTLKGLGGNDTYYVDNASDKVVEVVGGGKDTVTASVSYALAAGVEVETLRITSNGGTSTINLTGNEFAQTVIGNAGANIINGKGGGDALTGLGGKDIFRFDTALGSGNVDNITDFLVIDDTIQLENAIFKALTATGTLASAAFRANTTGKAGDASDRIIYETDTGKLFYDADGTGATAGVHFATLTANLGLTNADFVVI
jgi:Ca2+-binding RTX toxin-like protein